MGLLLGHMPFVKSGVLFTPNIIGRQQVNGLLSEATADDTVKGPAASSAHNDIWIITTATEVEVRINTRSAPPGGTETWWNDAGVPQGVPGSTELVFELGERSGVTFNLFTQSVDLPAGMTHIKIAANFTDDNQVSFLSPTNAVRYGWFYDAEAEDPGNDIVTGNVIHKLTFRKAGFQDFIIRYEQRSDATATNEK